MIDYLAVNFGVAAVVAAFLFLHLSGVVEEWVWVALDVTIGAFLAYQAAQPHVSQHVANPAMPANHTPDGTLGLFAGAAIGIGASILWRRRPS